MKQNSVQVTLLAILMTVVMSACNNNKGRGSNTGANMGVLPTTTCLLSPNGYSGQCNYSYGSYPGFMNYDHTLFINGLNNNYANGFCGCSNGGGYPVYANNWGLGCINTSSLPQGNGYYNNTRFLTYFWNATNLQWVSSQQTSNYSYYGNNSCPQSVILACDTGVQGSCGASGVCVSLNPYGNGGGYSQSGPGLCILNQGNNGYYGNYPYYY